MAENNAVAEKKQFTTSISAWTNELTKLVARDFEECKVPFDDYSRECGMNAMTAIYQLVKNTDRTDLSQLDTSNLREVVGQVASLKLNANAIPQEVYFQLRSKQIGGQWVKVVEAGVQGDGFDTLLRNYGDGVKDVLPCWLVKDGDVFEYPRHKGIEITPPEWEEKGLSEKVIRVVYPIRMQDDSIQYLISERDSVKTNLFAHVRNNLMNETFGILKGTNSKGKAKTRYDATPEEKRQIDAEKEKIYEALRKCETVDEMLACPESRPYMSAAWLDTPESMIVRKMRNNAVKRFRKNFNSMARQSFNQMDETYVQARQEIEENANTEVFEEISDEAVSVEENEE